MNAPPHGRFEQSFARHMIRGCFPLLLAVAAVELSIRCAVLRFDFRTDGPHCVQRPAAQQAGGEFGELAQGLNPFLDRITLVVRGVDCILGGGRVGGRANARVPGPGVASFSSAGRHSPPVRTDRLAGSRGVSAEATTRSRPASFARYSARSARSMKSRRVSPATAWVTPKLAVA